MDRMDWMLPHVHDESNVIEKTSPKIPALSFRAVLIPDVSSLLELEWFN